MQNKPTLIDRLALHYATPSYSEAAKALGVSKSYISKLRRGVKPVTPKLQSRIMQLLGETNAE
jgi:transcriptional regulator with XRE-family HTH domain